MGVEPIGSEKRGASERTFLDNLWCLVCLTTEGSHDPITNPEKDPNVGRLGCRKILVCVAEDLLKERGRYYKEVVEKSEWKGGVVEVMETKDEGHVFHLFKPTCDNAMAMLNTIVSFFNNTLFRLIINHSSHLTTLPATTAAYNDSAFAEPGERRRRRPTTMTMVSPSSSPSTVAPRSELCQGHGQRSDCDSSSHQISAFSCVSLSPAIPPPLLHPSLDMSSSQVLSHHTVAACSL